MSQAGPRRLSLLFLGAPGVGKGTFSKLIAPSFNAEIMTSSDLLRDAADREQGADGAYIAECIGSGKLVSDEVVVPIVTSFLQSVPHSLILDGFPRTLNQAQRLQQHFPLDLGIYFRLPHHILLRKLLGRRVCGDPSCGASFNICEVAEGEIVMPSMAPKEHGVCDECSGQLKIRVDDTAEIIEERLKTFYQQNDPIVEFYRAEGLLLEYKVKRGIDDVPDITKSIRERLDI